jgi:uncharacterized protein YoaH (UPF0181 family)
MTVKEASNKIVEKIQKLLALGKSPNEAEAMAAMQKAQELLALHDLAMSDIQGRADEPSEDVTREEIENGMKSAPAWQGWILSGLAKVNHCQSFSSSGTFHLIGKPHRIAIVKSLFSYLIDTVEREQKKAMAIAKRDPDAEPNLYGTQRYSWRKWSTDFKQGMASRIHKRLTEQAEQTKREGTGQVSGLVIQNQYNLARRENDAWMRENGLRLSSRRTTTRNSSGYGAGQAAGNRAGLNAQMGAGATGSRMALPGRRPITGPVRSLAGPTVNL